MSELPIIMRFRDEASRPIQGVGRELQGLEQSASRAGLQTAALEQRSSLLAQEMSRLGKEVAQGKISVDQAEKEFNKFESTLAKVEVQAEETQGVFGRMRSGVSQAGQAWSQIATPIQSTIALLQQAGQAAQQAYQYVGEGVQMTAAQGRFEALTNSVGTTSSAMVNDLRAATRGTVDDFKLMEGASQLLNLGLTKTAEETVRLGAVSGKLGWDMQVLGLTIANQSTMRLDALGLAIEDVQGRAERLRAQGMATDQAFKFAIIEAGEAKVRLLGDAADTTAGKLLVMEANAKNFGNSFKMAFSENLIQNINAVAGGVFETEEGSAKLGETLGKIATNVSFMGFIRLVKEGLSDQTIEYDRGREAARQNAQITAYNAEVYARLYPEIDRSREAMSQFSQTVESNVDAMRQARIEAYEQSTAYAEFDDKLVQTSYHYTENEAAIAAANARLVEWGQTIPTVTGAIYASDEAVAAYNARMGDHAVTAMRAGEEGVNLNQVVLDSINSFGGGAEAVIGYALATGQLTQAQAENMLKQAAMIEYAGQLGEQLASGSISINDAVTALTSFEAGLSTSNIMVNTATGSVQLLDESLVGASSSVGSLQTGMDEFTTDNAVGATQAFIDRLNSIPDRKVVQIEVQGGDAGASGATNYGNGGYQETYSRGGRVRGGTPGRDSVPALLMPDEEVLTVDEARRYRQVKQAGMLSSPFVPGRASDGGSSSSSATAPTAAASNISITVPITITGSVDRAVYGKMKDEIKTIVRDALRAQGNQASTGARMRSRY